jgi:hypothetical protein
VEFATLLFHDE